jgi:hypothetical protein
MIDFPYRYDVKKVSLSGMLIETDYPLDLNTHHSMELFLDSDILGILGRIANCTKKQMVDQEKFDVGIEFIGMSDNDKVILKEFIDTLD